MSLFYNARRMKMKKKIVRIGMPFLTCFLLMFMLLIFGPSEIFFANVANFDFVYGDFIGYMIVFAVVGTLILTLFIVLLIGLGVSFYLLFWGVPLQAIFK